MIKINSSKKILSILLLLWLLVPQYSHSETEASIKAKYVYALIKFVKWPVAHDHYSICLLGKGSEIDAIEGLEGRKLHNKPIRVTRVNQLSESCHVAYIGRNELNFVQEIIESVYEQPILTLSSIEEFTEVGGIFEFIRLGNLVKFNVNYYRATELNIRISAKILELANEIKWND